MMIYQKTKKADLFRENRLVFATVSQPGDYAFTGSMKLPTSDPTTPVAGQIWFDLANNRFEARNNSSTVTLGGSSSGVAGSLDDVYQNGGTISLEISDVIFNQADATSDYDVKIRATIAGTYNDAIVIDAYAASTVYTDGLIFKTTGAGSTITDAIDASDAEITNAINVGANVILGTTAVIDFTNFDVAASGNTAIGGTLAVTGASTLTGNVVASGTLAVTGASTLTGNVTASGTLAVTGNTTVGGTFGATGNSTVGGTLAVTGASTLTGAVGITGIATLADNLVVSDGSLTLTNTANEVTTTLTNSNGGATGVQVRFHHNSATPADADVITRLLFAGEDDGSTLTDYAKIDVVATDVTNATEDADILFYVFRAGTSTLTLQLDSDVNGVVVGDGAAEGVVSSSGAFNLSLITGNATTGSIVIVDGASGDIDLTPNGTGTVTIPNDAGLKVGAGDDFTIALATDNVTLANATSDKDIIFSVNDGGVVGEVCRFDGSETSLLFATDKQLQFRDTGIYISSGADGKLTISADGAGADDITLSGTVTVSDTLTASTAVVLAGIETIAAAGTSTALSLTKTVHDIDADAGGDIFTLANGTAGQLCVCVMKTATGVATITPAAMMGGTSVTVNAEGDTVILVYTTNGWAIIGGNGYTVI